MRETQRKGDIAVSRAIASFTKLGFDVSLPLTESAAYDIIVDIGEKLKRVQVRFAYNGEVDLRRVHSNSMVYVVKKPKHILNKTAPKRSCFYLQRRLKGLY